MRKRIGIICLIVGAVLILSALLLFFFTRLTDHNAGKQAEAMLDDIREEIKLRMENTGENDTPDTGTTDSSAGAEDTSPSDESTDMPVFEINGNGFVGYLTIPALSLELPVLSEWNGDYAKLNIAPCRHFGSTITDDLVIAGHNYTSHFAYLSELSVGHTIIFTDMNGNAVTYSIEKFEVVDPDKVDYIKNSGYDLVLYTCTYSGSTRFTVFANRITEN